MPLFFLCRKDENNMNEQVLLDQLVSKIVQVCAPDRIVLVSSKHNPKQELTGFKLAVVVEDVDSTAELEGRLYLQLDCDVPYDLLIYNRTQWKRLLKEPDSFAFRANASGMVLYG